MEASEQDMLDTINVKINQEQLCVFCDDKYGYKNEEIKAEEWMRSAEGRRPQTFAIFVFDLEHSLFFFFLISESPSPT